MQSSFNCYFSDGFEKNWSGIYGKKNILSDDALNKLKKSLSEYLEVPIFALGNDNDMDKLVDIVTDYFVQ